MGRIRQIGGLYYIDFTARGLLYSQVAGTHLEEAQKLLRQIEEKIAGGEALMIVRHIDLPDFYERFLSEANLQYPPQTVKRFVGVIKHFSGFLQRNFPQINQLAQLTPAVMEAYKVYLAKSQKPKIVNLTVLLIRDILEFGIKLGFINDNPCLHVRLLPWPKTSLRRPTSRFQKAQELLSQGTGLGKLAQLLKLPDISRGIYFAHLIPIHREDMYK
jgi:hypothetical protein